MYRTHFRRHPIITAVVGLFALLLALFIAAVLYIIIFSESLLRSLVENNGSEMLGREIKIEGAVTVDWRWRDTHILVERLRLDNAEGFSEPDMVRIELIDLKFKPLQLLRGNIDISEINIISPEIFLERRSQDSANWNFPALAKSQPADTVAPDDRYEFPFIDQLKIEKGHLVFNDAVKNLNLDVQLDSIRGGDNVAANEDEGYKLSGKGKLQGQDFTMEASGGSLKALRDSSALFPLKFKLEAGATKVELDGTFQDPIKMTGMDARLMVSGESLADIFYFTAIPLPPTPNYTLNGQLTKAGSVWAYNKFEGHVGSSDLSGNLSYDVGGERGFFSADLTSNVLDAADLGGFIGLSEEEDKEESSKIIPDVPLARERLLATDLDVKLRANKIEAPNLPFKGMNVRFNLRNGILKLDPLELSLASGTVKGIVEIDANPEVPPMKMDLKVRHLSLGEFFKGTRFEETTRGSFGGKAVLAGEGASLANVLATSNGELVLGMSGGEISQLLIEAADLDLGQALPLFLGKDEATRINCGVIAFDVEAGMLSSKVLALDTNDSLLVGDVGINLKDEIIDARLDAKPKDNSLLSLRIPITIKGRLKDPSIGLDKEKTTTRGTAAIALGTLLTPFAAILAFIEKGEEHETDCRGLFKDAQQKKKG